MKQIININMKNLIVSEGSYYNEFLEKRVISNTYEVEWIENASLKTKFFSTREEAELFIKKLDKDNIINSGFDEKIS